MPDSQKTGSSQDKVKKTRVRRMPPPKKNTEPVSGRVKLWFREMRSELRKVVWPTPRQVLNNSIIVAVAVLIVGALIAVYDFGAEELVKAIIVSFSPAGAGVS